MLVLDANILIRAVLGSRVLALLRKYADQVEFLAPDTAFQEAREHLGELVEVPFDPGVDDVAPGAAQPDRREQVTHVLRLDLAGEHEAERAFDQRGGSFARCRRWRQCLFHQRRQPQRRDRRAPR